MSAICENCGKKTVFGRTQRHARGIAGRRWSKRAHKTSRTFKPNLQKATALISGKYKQIKVCAKCLKKLKSEGLTKSYQNGLQSAQL